MAIRRIADLPNYTSLSGEHLDPKLSSCLFEASILNSEREYKSVHVPATAVVGKAFEFVQEGALTSFVVDGGKAMLVDTDVAASGENFSVTHAVVGVRSNGDAAFEAVGSATLAAGRRMDVRGNPVVINNNLTVYGDRVETGNAFVVNGLAQFGNARNSVLARTLRTSDIGLDGYSNDVVTCELLNQLVYGYWKAKTRNLTLQLVNIQEPDPPYTTQRMAVFYKDAAAETWQCAVQRGGGGGIWNVTVPFAYGSTVYAYASAPDGYRIDPPNDVYTQASPAVFSMTENRSFAATMSKIA